MTRHWQPLPSVYRNLPDFGHPLTEAFAIDLHVATPFDTVPELPEGAYRVVWERQNPVVREIFRERARRLLWGDLTVIPTRLPPGYGAAMGINFLTDD